MTSLIKKSILKFLTQFTSNLAPDDIQLSSLKGEAEVRNLELSTSALQNLLNIPTWLKVNHAKVNHVGLKIHLMSIQTKPIRITFDHVTLEVEAIQSPRAPNGPSPLQDNSSGTTNYGLTESIIEGIRVEINAVSMTFKSVAFTANIMIQSVLVFSAKGDWTQSQDLRETRAKTDKEVISRKKIQWMSFRLEATWPDAAPVKLITNQGEVRIRLRRRIADCVVLANKLEVLLDDLLWILSDRQIQAALLCVKSLSDAIEASRRQMMKLQRSNSDMSLASSDTSTAANPENHLQESSQHFSINKLDLHICEESSDASSVQLSLYDLAVDLYPGRKAAKSRKEFNPYTAAMMARDKWVEPILNVFREDFKLLREKSKPVERVTKLKENVVVLRLRNVDLYQVSSPTRHNSEGKKLFSFGGKKLNLPSDIPLFHYEATEYYTPDGSDYVLPHNNQYIQINAPVIEFDEETVIWMSKILTNASKCINEALVELGLDEEKDPSTVDHVDMLVDIILPSVNFGELHLEASSISLTNRLLQKHICLLSNLVDIYNFIEKSPFQIHSSKLAPFIAATKTQSPTLQKYLATTANPRFCRAAVIAKAIDDLFTIHVAEVFVEIGKTKPKKLILPISVDVYAQLDKQIIVHVPDVSTSVNHDDFITILQFLDQLGELSKKMLPNEAGNDPPENQPSPNIDVLVKSVELDLELVPFSSKLSDLPAEPALKGMPKQTPLQLPKSLLQVKLVPILVKILPDGEMTISSNVHVLNKNYLTKTKEKFASYLLNGARVSSVANQPTLEVQIKDDDIFVKVQNTKIEILSSIVSDLGPFAESPIPPAEGPTIHITLENIGLILLPDVPPFYEKTVVSDLQIGIEQLSIAKLPNGALSIGKLSACPDIPGLSSGPSSSLQGETEKAPKPPPRNRSLHVQTKSSETQTDPTTPRSLSPEQIEYNDGIIGDLQDRNLALMREREALRETLEQMQDAMIESEQRSEAYRSQFLAMKQLLEHQKTGLK